MMPLQMKRWFYIGVYFFILIGFGIWGALVPESAYAVDYSVKNMSPSLSYLFGTDNMGRDMFMRSIKGLSISLEVGLGAAFVSSCIAIALGTMSALFGGKIDRLVIWLIDVFMGIPHILLILMISVLMGGGVQGIILGIIVTHWPRLTRIIRAEILQLRNQPYIIAAKRYGTSNSTIMMKHMWPHVFPQYLVGLVLLFPHAIMHEAAISFLGYGLPLDMPAIGIILAESMKYMALGMWWLAFFPGALLLLVVFVFERLGTQLQKLLNPLDIHE